MFLIVVALACLWYAWRFETSVPYSCCPGLYVVCLGLKLGGLKQVFLIVVALACMWYAWRFETSVPYSCCPGLFVVCLEV